MNIIDDSVCQFLVPEIGLHEIGNYFYNQQRVQWALGKIVAKSCLSQADIILLREGYPTVTRKKCLATLTQASVMYTVSSKVYTGL